MRVTIRRRDAKKLNALNAKLDRVLLLLEGLAGEQTKLKKEIKDMAGELDRLTSEVEENTSVTGSAITLLNNLSQLIRDAGTDPTKLSALADQLDSNSAALAAAVAANTPAAPPA